MSPTTESSLYSPRKDGFLCGNLSSIVSMQRTHFLCRAKNKFLGLQVNPSFSFNKTFFFKCLVHLVGFFFFSCFPFPESQLIPHILFVSYWGGNPQPEIVRAGLELVAFKQPWHRLGWGPGHQNQAQLYILHTSF